MPRSSQTAFSWIVVAVLVSCVDQEQPLTSESTAPLTNLDGPAASGSLRPVEYRDLGASPMTFPTKAMFAVSPSGRVYVADHAYPDPKVWTYADREWPVALDAPFGPDMFGSPSAVAPYNETSFLVGTREPYSGRILRIDHRTGQVVGNSGAWQSPVWSWYGAFQNFEGTLLFSNSGGNWYIPQTGQVGGCDNAMRDFAFDGEAHYVLRSGYPWEVNPLGPYPGRSLLLFKQPVHGPCAAAPFAVLLPGELPPGTPILSSVATAVDDSGHVYLAALYGLEGTTTLYLAARDTQTNSVVWSRTESFPSTNAHDDVRLHVHAGRLIVVFHSLIPGIEVRSFSLPSATSPLILRWTAQLPNVAHVDHVIDRDGGLVVLGRSGVLGEQVKHLVEVTATGRVLAERREMSGLRTPIAVDVDARGYVYTLDGEEDYTWFVGEPPRVTRYARDADGDGLLDSWERDGYVSQLDPSIRLDLAALGARPDRKDLLVELDLMQDTLLDPEAHVALLRNAFAAAPVSNPDGSTGINLIVQISDRGLPKVPWPGRMQDLVATKDAYLGDASEREPTVTPTVAAAWREIRTRLFRYGVVASRVGGSNMTCGEAHMFGPNFVYYHDTPECLRLLSRVAPARRATVRAAILMHELGHTLGLSHGGGDGVLNKPNYHSVMNYMHLTPSDEATLILDYSDERGLTLDENNLDEQVGFGLGPAHAQHVIAKWGQLYVESGPVNFNDNAGDTDTHDTGLSYDLNGDSAYTELHGYDDWENLSFNQWEDPRWWDQVEAPEPPLDEVLSQQGACDMVAAPGCFCDIAGATRACSTDTGVCVQGTQTCDGVLWGACVGGVNPRAESCNTLDDDCDGANDETFPELGPACSAGVGACRRTGSMVCTSDMQGVACSATAAPPQLELCGNVSDDDCDGVSDEGFTDVGAACTTGIGACARDGERVCGPDGLGTTCGVEPGLPSPEVCDNGIDDDCDGIVEEGCPVHLVAPARGTKTGSSRVPLAPGLVTPITPTFEWRPLPGATTYEVSWDNDADFSSPFMIQQTSATSITRTIPIQFGQPWGQRAYWRVRARSSESVPWSPWSPVWYVDVGRLPDDVNGDGYSDLLVGAPGSSGTGGVWVYHGGGGILPGTTPNRVLSDSTDTTGARFGAAIATADIDGDGYSDALVGVPGRTVGSVTGAGRVAVYFGNATRLAGTGTTPSPPALLWHAPSPGVGDGFGSVVAAAGDVDGDGYEDVWIGAPSANLWKRPDAGAAYLFRGGPRGSISSTPWRSWSGSAAYEGFGAAIVSLGDLDGDGLVDAAIGATGMRRVTIVRASAEPGFTIDSIVPGFGRALAAGDFNGDGRPDLAVGARDGVTVYRGMAGAQLVAWQALGGPAASQIVQSLFALDIDRDGRSELVAGYPHSGSGEVLAWRGGTNVPLTQMFQSAATQSPAELGTGVLFADVEGDGYAELFASSPAVQLGTVRGWAHPAGGDFTTMGTYAPSGFSSGRFGEALR